MKIEPEPNMDWIFCLPKFMVPSAILMSCYAGKFFHWMDYVNERIFDQCQDHNGKIYDALILGVARHVRRKGLGDKLIKHAINYATEQGCSHVHTCASGQFSQKIMKNNGFDVFIEKPYGEFQDRNGKIMIDREPHKVCQVLTLKLAA